MGISKIVSIKAKENNDAFKVPSSKPPFSIGFVKKSPKVAPNGRVKINAIQKRII